jgi:hypothetical protein
VLTSNSQLAKNLVRWIPISSLRRDGQTQHRDAIDPKLVAEYAALMNHGDVFPPVRVWWDGNFYWLTDGFHRIAAGESLELPEAECEVFHGSLSDAQWDSYTANSFHGLRRTSTETQKIIWLAFRHPRALQISNVQLGKYLHLPEATVRRWRRKLSSANVEDTAGECKRDEVRIVNRGKSSYPMATANIGNHDHDRVGGSRSLKKLRSELSLMKGQASPCALRMLTAVGNWAFGSATPGQCLVAIEKMAQGWSGSKFTEALAQPQEVVEDDVLALSVGQILGPL